MSILTCFQDIYVKYNFVLKRKKVKVGNLLLVLLNTSFLVSCYFKYIPIFKMSLSNFLLNVRLIKRQLFFITFKPYYVYKEINIFNPNYFKSDLILFLFNVSIKVILEIVYKPFLTKNLWNLRFSSIFIFQTSLYFHTLYRNIWIKFCLF